MKTRSVIVGLLLATATFACGDDSEEAQKDCENFVNAWCTKVDSCTENDDFDSCLSLIRQDINCGAAVETSDQYDRCISDIDTVTCDTLDGTLPASCSGAIVVE